MNLSDRDRGSLAGDFGQAVRTAMEIVVAVGASEAAPRLIDVEGAHVDGCLYHGIAGLDFAEALVSGGGRVAVPTTLNVASLDLLHPDLYRGEPKTADLARRLMDAYVEMGCRASWTCAPYQLEQRPTLGQQVAWGESNAIVFANSVLGARTNRYGDFMDICCAITGRAPMTGLHTDEGRQATTVIELDVADGMLDLDLTYALIGHLMGRELGTEIGVISGLDERSSEDRLKALGAAAASSGAVAMFHAIGVTPEAPTLEAALGGRSATRRLTFDSSSLSAARDDLSSPTDTLGAVSVGTPHMSISELEILADLVRGRVSRVPFYVNTGRDTLALAESTGLLGALDDFGVVVVTDTCAYITPIMGELSGDLMTNSAKVAYYAPANLGVNVCLASLTECVESAVAGRPKTQDHFG